MSDRRAQLAALPKQIARTVMKTIDGQLGAVIVVVLDEIEGGIAMSGAAEFGSCETEEGEQRLVDIVTRLQPAIRGAAGDHAADAGAIAIDRPDLELHVPGGRPKS